MYLIKGVKYKVVMTTIHELTNDALLTLVNTNPKVPPNIITKYIYELIGSGSLKRLYAMNEFKPGDVYSFGAGHLDYDVLFNCVVSKNVNWVTLFGNLKLVMTEYKKHNKLNTATVYFLTYDEGILKTAFELFTDVGLKKVNILCSSIDELKKYESFLYKKNENKLFKNVIERFILKIGGYKK